ncbi:MAG: Na/Pi cotransporter family protein [Victivallaceae bacterium]|nr:Na/Pi cotransporter family protein [Victivallaceae bacterium]
MSTRCLVRVFAFLACVCIIGVLSGCGKDSAGKSAAIVNSVRIISGADQFANPGEKFQPLRMEFFHSSKGTFSGTTSVPVANEKIKVTALRSHSAALVPEAEEYRTDHGGTILINVTAAHKVGDYYLEVTPQSNPKEKVRIRFTVGMQLTGTNQEGGTNSKLSKPLKVHLVDDQGAPASDIPVYFELKGAADGRKSSAKVQPSMMRTNEHGEAFAQITTGKKTGAYEVAVEVAAPEKNYFLRSRTVRVMGVNVFTVVMTVLGGLTIFVFGMKLMSDGLQKIAGESMKKLLQFFASNSFVAVIAGALVTAVIQSSSATTVMVIGFINAGLLQLTQAIGIIFGANIGTTITAQIISFNLNAFALPAITIGFCVAMARRRFIKGWGESILGFGMIFFGMSMMSNELKVLGEFPSFIAFFQTFDCAPVNGVMPIGAVLGAVLIGAIATAMIQASAAAMGILLALSAGGLINFYTAVPLLLGTNIGTTITAILAALAANRVAKQAALAHTLFNVSGALVMIGLFYIPYGHTGIPIFLYFINSITPGDAFAVVPQNIERHIAMAHTFFNICNVVLLFPFIPMIARICQRMLPINDQRMAAVKMLEPHLLNTPSVALEQSVMAIRKMVSLAWDMVDRAVNEHFLKGNDDHKKAEVLAQDEAEVDAMQSEVTQYLVQITRRQLSKTQSELVPLLLHCTNDAERIADHTDNILKLTERLLKLDKKMSETGRHDLRKMWEILDKQARSVIKALNSTDEKKVFVALKAEAKINDLADRYEVAHIERLRKGNCNLALSVIFVEMLNELEKIGDHLSNIAERAPEIQKHYMKL